MIRVTRKMATFSIVSVSSEIRRGVSRSDDGGCGKLTRWISTLETVESVRCGGGCMTWDAQYWRPPPPDWHVLDSVLLFLHQTQLYFTAPSISQILLDRDWGSSPKSQNSRKAVWCRFRGQSQNQLPKLPQSDLDSRNYNSQINFDTNSSSIQSIWQYSSKICLPGTRVHGES